MREDTAVGECDGDVGEVGLAWMGGADWVVGDCGWDCGLEGSESWLLARKSLSMPSRLKLGGDATEMSKKEEEKNKIKLNS